MSKTQPDHANVRAHRHQWLIGHARRATPTLLPCAPVSSARSPARPVGSLTVSVYLPPHGICHAAERNRRQVNRVEQNRRSSRGSAGVLRWVLGIGSKAGGACARFCCSDAVPGCVQARYSAVTRRWRACGRPHTLGTRWIWVPPAQQRSPQLTRHGAQRLPPPSWPATPLAA
jgi:hypothetical protein